MPYGVLPGHGHRPDRTGGYDTGARSPAGWDEADLVRAVAIGILSISPSSRIASSGTYQQRGRDLLSALGNVPVVQLHADAVPAEVGPDRATIWTWPGNAEARTLAERVLLHLSPAVPWPVLIREASASIGWHAGARSCLAAVAQTSILIEVGYTDGALGRDVLPGLAHEIGRAIGRGLA